MPPTNAPFYRERRHRRRPAASCRCHFLRLGGSRIEYSAGRNSSRASVSRAGERGTFPSQRRVYRTPLSKTIAKLRPESLIEQRLFLIRMSANVTMLRYTNPLIESQRLMYSSRSLRTWSAVYGPSLELNDCQPVCR